MRKVNELKVGRVLGSWGGCHVEEGRGGGVK